MFIEKIFNTLSKSEKKEFLLFLDRKKRKANRKDIQVCEALINNVKPKIEKANNYHAIRNRIKKELILFTYLKQVETDTTKESEILNEINLCRFLFNNQLEKEAWSYLAKVEKKAVEIKNYKNLYAIYILMLEFSHTNHTINLNALIAKKNAIKVNLDQEELLIDTLAIARKRLQLFKTTVATQSLASLIEEIQEDININHPSFYQHPKQVCNYLELVRGSLLYNRDIRKLEPIALNLYRTTQQQNSFTIHTLEYQLRILYILSHSLYRNQKLKESLVYINELESALKAYNLAQYKFYFAKTIALKSSIFFLSNQLNNAIQIIEDYLETTPKISNVDELNLKLNLLTYYSYHKAYKKANKFFIQMHHSDGWYKKIMGQEWVFKKNSIEMLLQLEMGKDDIALNRINSIIKNNTELVELPQYKDIIYFLKLFKKYIEDPTSVQEKNLLTISKKSNVVSVDNEIKKTAFYSWFLAKVKQQDPYLFLLNTIKEIKI
ncbi:MAG: hypothetical protein N4A35_10330 [Flavobacteriales bacterium]|jgi:hypothetical protein|nr:hypothetical protein [Flavobacteriales bacterium]